MTEPVSVEALHHSVGIIGSIISSLGVYSSQ
jgi:hypothetical protein